MGWAPDYATADLVKNYLNIQHANDDLFVAGWITAVSRNVDDFCNRQFGQTDLESRKYTPVWDHTNLRSYLEIDDLHDITGFTLTDASGTLITDYQLEPRNSIQKGRPYTRVAMRQNYSYINIGYPVPNFQDNDITCMGKWGWNTVPSSIPTAFYIQASRIAARRSAPFGIAGSPSDGSEVRLLAQLDPDFRTTLKPYQRTWFVK